MIENRRNKCSVAPLGDCRLVSCQGNYKKEFSDTKGKASGSEFSILVYGDCPIIRSDCCCAT